MGLRQVAVDVGDQLGGVRGEEADLAIAAELDDHRVGDCLPADEVEVRRQRWIDAHGYAVT